jgi:hypothetical protein
VSAGAYPGTFNPPTVAHLAIAEAAHRQAGLDRVDLVVSETPLGKDAVVRPSLDERLVVLAEVAASRPWLGVARSSRRFVADLAEGYDAVVMGGDKWAQVCDPAWYGGSAERRDAFLRRLPRVIVVARTGHPQPRGLPGGTPPVEVLEVGAEYAGVSSTQVRAGRAEWMLPEAAALARRTGAWGAPGSDRRRRGSGGSSMAPSSEGSLPGCP